MRWRGYTGTKKDLGSPIGVGDDGKRQQRKSLYHRQISDTEEERMKAQIEIINIMWEGPLNLEDVKKYTRSGVYQYYGDHHVYGSDVLLYIGQAENLADRIRGHHFDKLCDRNIKIYFGPVKQDMLDRVEKLLICANAPARNNQQVREPLDVTEDKSLLNLLILNWGNYRSLLPEISGYRFTNHLYKKYPWS